MSLDPQVEKVIWKMNSEPAMDTTSLEKARKAFAKNRPPESEFIPIGKVEDLTISYMDEGVPIRVYTPDGEGDFPALIFFHGGGFVLGNLDMNDGLCRLIAKEAQCVVVSVDYRLAPEHKFPVAVNDSFAVVKWVHQNGNRLRIDTTCIAVGGQSAGGNLAVVMAYLAKENNIPIVKQIVVYPMLDYNFQTPSQQKYATGYNLTSSQVEFYWENYLNSKEDRNNPLACPLQIEDVSGFPGALIITAEYDPLTSDGEIYADRLKKAGVQVEYSCYEGMIHPFLSMWDKWDKSREAALQIASSLKSTFCKHNENILNK